MKYMNKKKLIAMMALLIVAASFGGCNSANTTATIDPEVTSSEIVSSAPVSSEATSSEAVSSAPVSSEEEKAESEAVSSEAATSSAAEVSSKTEVQAISSEPAVSSAPAAVSQPTTSSAPAAVSEPVATSQPVSSTASSAPVESAPQTSSAPPAQTVSVPTQQQTGTTKSFEDMTEEELDQWMLEQLERLNNQPINLHHLGTEKSYVESTPPAEDVGDDAEWEALAKEKTEQIKKELLEAQNKQDPDASQVVEQEPESDPVEKQEEEYQPHTPTFDSVAYAELTVKLANDERKKNGLSEVAIDPELMRLASLRAEELAVSFSHTRPNGENDCYTGSPDYEWVMCNIGQGYATPASVVDGWMNSAGHKRNILYPNHTAVGAGVYEDGSGTRYWCIIYYNEGGKYPNY